MKNKNPLAGVFLVLVISFIVSCKKEPADAANAGSNNNTEIAVMPNGIPQGTYNSILNISEGKTNNNLIIHTTSASFYQNPSPYASSNPKVDVVSVSVNNTLLAHTGPGAYDDTTGSITFPPASWVVTGNSVIPSFIYTNSDPFPILDTMAVPGIVHLNSDIHIHLNNSSGFNAVYLSISDTAGNYTRIGSNNLLYATLPKDSLARFTSGTHGSLYFSLVKYETKNLRGKNVLFITEKYYGKKISFL